MFLLTDIGPVPTTDVNLTPLMGMVLQRIHHLTARGATEFGPGRFGPAFVTELGPTELGPSVRPVRVRPRRVSPNPEEARPRRVGPPEVRGPKISCFFSPFSRLVFHPSCSLSASSRGILVVFEALRPSQMCTFGVLGLSCETPGGPSISGGEGQC